MVVFLINKCIKSLQLNIFQSNYRMQTPMPQNRYNTPMKFAFELLTLHPTALCYCIHKSDRNLVYLLQL